MSNPIADPGHGHSPAAWTAVIIMLVGVAIGTFFFFLDMPVVVWIAAGIVVVGALVGWGMAKAGYGVNGSKYARERALTMLADLTAGAVAGCRGPRLRAAARRRRGSRTRAARRRSTPSPRSHPPTASRSSPR